MSRRNSVCSVQFRVQRVGDPVRTEGLEETLRYPCNLNYNESAGSVTKRLSLLLMLSVSLGYDLSVYAIS